MSEGFVTAAYEATALLIELLEHRKKKHPDSLDASYDATLVHRINSALVAMRVNHPSTGSAGRAHDARAAPPQEPRRDRTPEARRTEERPQPRAHERTAIVPRRR
jgi:hypothetical protein